MAVTVHGGLNRGPACFALNKIFGKTGGGAGVTQLGLDKLDIFILGKKEGCVGMT